MHSFHFIELNFDFIRYAKISSFTRKWYKNIISFVELVSVFHMVFSTLINLINCIFFISLFSLWTYFETDNSFYRHSLRTLWIRSLENNYYLATLLSNHETHRMNKSPEQWFGNDCLHSSIQSLIKFRQWKEYTFFCVLKISILNVDIFCSSKFFLLCHPFCALFSFEAETYFLL